MIGVSVESCPVDETIHLSARLDEITYGAAWTHKIHEKQADIYELIGKVLSLIPIVTVAASGSGAIASIVVDGYVLKCVVAALSAVSLFCTLWAKSFASQGGNLTGITTINFTPSFGQPA